jgi:hypothetical protein
VAPGIPSHVAGHADFRLHGAGRITVPVPRFFVSKEEDAARHDRPCRCCGWGADAGAAAFASFLSPSMRRLSIPSRIGRDERLSFGSTSQRLGDAARETRPGPPRRRWMWVDASSCGCQRARTVLGRPEFEEFARHLQ